MVRHLIFDLDGTLIDSAGDILQSLKKAMRNAGIDDVPELSVHLIGPPIRDILQKLPIQIENNLTEQIITNFRMDYDNGPMTDTVLYPRVKEMLIDLRNKGYRLYVATNKPTKPASRILDCLLPGFFGDWISINSLGERNLSKTQMIHQLIARNKMKPAHVCVIGDGRSDIVGAFENKCQAIGVLYGYGTKDELASVGCSIFVEDAVSLAIELNKLK